MTTKAERRAKKRMKRWLKSLDRGFKRLKDRGPIADMGLERVLRRYLPEGNYVKKSVCHGPLRLSDGSDFMQTPLDAALKRQDDQQS